MMNMAADDPDKTRLRAAAESCAKSQARMRAGQDDYHGMSSEQMQRLIIELHTHQIELEMQNEELRRTQQQLLESRDQYAQLFDFAPVGYLTLDTKAMIRESNQAASRMLGCPKTKLRNTPYRGHHAGCIAGTWGAIPLYA